MGEVPLLEMEILDKVLPVDGRSSVHWFDERKSCDWEEL